MSVETKADQYINIVARFEVITMFKSLQVLTKLTILIIQTLCVYFYSIIENFFELTMYFFNLFNQCI